VTPPGWRPDLRDRDIDVPKDTQRIEAPTPYVWIIGRTKTEGPSDYEGSESSGGVSKSLRSLSGAKHSSPPEVKVDPSVDMKTPSREQVDTMPVGRFFAYAAGLAQLVHASSELVRCFGTTSSISR
jgi:hypothetical protein